MSESKIYSGGNNKVKTVIQNNKILVETVTHHSCSSAHPFAYIHTAAFKCCVQCFSV